MEITTTQLLTSLHTCEKLGKLRPDGNISRCENCMFQNEDDCFSSMLVASIEALMKKDVDGK